MHTLTSDNIFSEGLNWGISYDLPNESRPELDPFLDLRRQDEPENVYFNSKKNYKNYTKHDKYNSYNYKKMSWNDKEKYYALKQSVQNI